MAGPLSVRANVVWGVVGNATYNLCLWLIFVQLARFDPSGRAAGQYALAYALTLPISLFCNLQLRQALATDARDQHPFADYFGLRLFSLPLAFAAFSLLAVLGGYPRDTVLLILSVGLLKTADSLSDILHGLLQRHERIRTMGLLLMARGLLGAGGILVGLTVFGSVLTGLSLAVCALVALFVLVELPLGARLIGGSLLRPRFHWQAWKQMAAFTLPLGFTGLVTMGMQQAPQILIGALHGETALGVFSSMYTPIMAMNILVGAAGEAIMPRMALLIAHRDRAGLNHLLVRLLPSAAAAGVIAAGGTALLGETFLARVYGPTFAREADAFVWMACGAGVGFVGVVFSFVTLAGRWFRQIFWMWTALALPTISTYWIFIAREGLLGAAHAFFLTSAVFTLMLALMARAVIGTLPGSPSDDPELFRETDAFIRRRFSPWRRYAMRADRRGCAHLPPPRVLAVHPLRPAGGRRLCLFAHHDSGRRIDPYVVHYLEALRALDCDVILASSSAPLQAADLERVSGSCLAVIERENGGLDFGSWKQSLSWLGVWDRYDELILANDSVYGPVFPLSDVFAEMSTRRCDAWSITDCLPMGLHLQSYFMVLRAPVLRSPVWGAFWTELPFFRNKDNVIRDGEVGLSRRLMRAGFALEAYRSCDWITRIAQGGGAPEALIDAQVRGRLDRTSPPLSHWKLLLQEGRSPFLKRELLTSNPHHLASLRDARPWLREHTAYDVNLIDAHLARIGRPAAF